MANSIFKECFMVGVFAVHFGSILREKIIRYKDEIIRGLIFWERYQLKHLIQGQQIIDYLRIILFPHYK